MFISLPFRESYLSNPCFNSSRLLGRATAMRALLIVVVHGKNISEKKENLRNRRRKGKVGDQKNPKMTTTTTTSLTTMILLASRIGGNDAGDREPKFSRRSKEELKSGTKSKNDGPKEASGMMGDLRKQNQGKNRVAEFLPAQKNPYARQEHL